MALTPRVGGREILRLAVPAFGALVAEPLFILADYAIVGRLGTGALGALGVAGAALTSLVSVCVFLAYGTTAAVARQVGAGDLPRAVKRGVDGLWLAAGIGVVLIAAGWPLAPWIVELFGASPEVSAQAVTYLRVSLLGTPAMLVILAGTGVLRGLQDTVTPLAVSVGSFALNALLNAVFVLVLHWGIAGSAWGTVLAQALGAVVYVLVVVRAAREHHVPMRPDPAGIRDSGTAGIALLIRTVCMRVVLIVATVVATRMGDAPLAAHAIATQIWTLTAFALDAIAIAGQAITGRALGAGDVHLTRSATRTMVIWGVGYGVVLGVVITLARPVLPGLFDADPAVAAALVSVLWVVAALQPVAGVVFVLDGVLIGAGDRRFLAWASALTTAAYLPAAYAVVHTGGGLVALWLALGVWMAARLLTLGARAYGRAWLVTGA
ncbi:MATE family efflux transporter [Sphaerisporangium krabiense]|uniref:Putative MATE family efflux protein n=1 Tax=Sphaerisporangium krabiense TaxID=763782 RepID=A0A7W8Z2U8_9ACTN|nr:MATE family efflux transporter [Sphaerisporangium krabiense]MBB5626396.1 putative MATE family efflux protein [Sphaerisporangium krabiense]GII63313.1 MATE family efflux transporter [Sphaerisporangium krabiense]